MSLLPPRHDADGPTARLVATAQELKAFPAVPAALPTDQPAPRQLPPPGPQPWVDVYRSLKLSDTRMPTTRYLQPLPDADASMSDQLSFGGDDFLAPPNLGSGNGCADDKQKRRCGDCGDIEGRSDLDDPTGECAYRKRLRRLDQLPAGVEIVVSPWDPACAAWFPRSGEA